MATATMAFRVVDGAYSEQLVFGKANGLREVGSSPAYQQVVAVLTEPDTPESRRRRTITWQGCVVPEIHPENYSKLRVREHPWIEELTQLSKEKLAQAKDGVFRRENLPAMATLAVSSAATGMLLTAASSPAICFGFYAVFIAAIAVVTASMSK